MFLSIIISYHRKKINIRSNSSWGGVPFIWSIGFMLASFSIFYFLKFLKEIYKILKNYYNFSTLKRHCLKLEVRLNKLKELEGNINKLITARAP